MLLGADTSDFTQHYPTPADGCTHLLQVSTALPGYSASAIAVARIGLLDRARLEQGFESTHTTSPAGAPLASIDGVRRCYKFRRELLERLLSNVSDPQSFNQ